MTKSPVLFHASQNRAITLFEPRQTHVRDKNEGPVVFATTNKAVASIFIVPSDDSWVLSGLHNGVPYIVISDAQRYQQTDRGGAIYHLPSDTFTCDPHKGLRDNEWTSKESVKPLDKEIYESGIEAMLSLGVQVYKVRKDRFGAIRTSDDHGFQIMQNTQSENQRLHRNITPFTR